MENTASSGLALKIRYSLELVKFSHSLFALPFALAAFFVASRGSFRLTTLFWVLLSVVAARTAAMGFNRWVDADIDAKNPRTQDRHLPSGKLSLAWVKMLVIVASALFMIGASQINRLSLWLAPLCLALLFLYSLTKRFTHYTQLFLGLALGMAPIGAAIAATGVWNWPACVLGLAVLCWVAGFDLLYALQDIDFDRSHGVYSLAAKLGTKSSLKLSRLLHALFFVGLLSYGWIEHLGWLAWLGISICGIFLLWQHRLLRQDLTRINAAFFTANGLLSLCFLAFISADVFFT